MIFLRAFNPMLICCASYNAHLLRRPCVALNHFPGGGAERFCEAKSSGERREATKWRSAPRLRGAFGLGTRSTAPNNSAYTQGLAAGARPRFRAATTPFFLNGAYHKTDKRNRRNYAPEHTLRIIIPQLARSEKTGKGRGRGEGFPLAPRSTRPVELNHPNIARTSSRRVGGSHSSKREQGGTSP